MPSLFKLIDNVAVTISGYEENKVWFSSIDLKYAYSQIPLSKKKQVTTAILVSWEETSQAHITSKLEFTD